MSADEDFLDTNVLLYLMSGEPAKADRAEALIKALSPDVLFKGSDYAEADLVGGEHVRANGGRVELLPLLAGHSTTGTVNRVKKIDPD